MPLSDPGFDRARYAKDPAYRAKILEFTDLREEIQAREARTDINKAISYIFGVKQWPFHRRLQGFFDANQLATVDAPWGHGKSFQVSIARKLFQLGVNCNENIGMVSNAPELAEQYVDVIRTNIESNERCHKVFPHLRIDKFGRSRGNLRLTVERPPSNLKDPSIVAIGIEGSIPGRRWSILDTDDFLDIDSTWTEQARRKTTTRFDQAVLSRLDPNGRHEDVGTPFNLTDTRHVIRAKPGYAYARFDGETGTMHDKAGKLVAQIAVGGLWPELHIDPISKKQSGWPAWRIEWARQNFNPEEFARSIRCIARSGAIAAFKIEDLEYAKALGVQMGLGRMPIPARPGEAVVTGIDLAISKKDVADSTAMHTGTVREGPYGRTKVTLDARSGRWELKERLREVLDILRTYPDHAGFRVENNAAQDDFLSILNDHDMIRSVGFEDSDLDRIRVMPHTTTAKYKRDPTIGVRGMSIDFAQKRWALPCGDGMRVEKEIQLLLDGLLSFDPTSHTSDQVIAAWLFNEATRHTGLAARGPWEEFGIA
jgi:hypothetical protein